MKSTLACAAPARAFFSVVRRARTRLCLFSALACASVVSAQQEIVTITALSGAKQTYRGLGVSNRGYSANTVAKRQELADLVIRDLGMNVLRVWFVDFPKYTDQQMYENFKRDYVDNGQIADFRARGVTILLASPAFGQTPPDNISAYAQRMVNILRLIKINLNIDFTALALSNEPQGWTDAQWVQHVHATKAALSSATDLSGGPILRDVKLIAGDWASVDSTMQARTQALINDTTSPNAWSKVDAVGSHSYSVCANDRIESILRGSNGGGREWWQTESCDPGLELLGDDARAVKTASRFLNDMNNSVNYWIYFIGFMRSDSGDQDRGTKLVVYDPGVNQNLVFLKYHYLKELTKTFDIGAVFRRTEATRVRNQATGMDWNDPYKPATNAAVARNPDGSWAIGLTNLTGLPTEYDSRTGGLLSQYRGSITLGVRVEINELSTAGAVRFQAYRTRKNGTTVAVDNLGVLTMNNGVLTIPSTTLILNPRDLLTLRSSPTTLEPVADTYVRDGTPYATENYGLSSQLFVKNDVAGYNRRIFLRFDLSRVVAPITSATLRLVPVSQGTDSNFGTAVHLAVDNWNELQATWNVQPSFNSLPAYTRPASPAYVLNTPATFDVTAIAQSEAAGDNQLSLALRSNTAGNEKFVQFGSTDNSNANVRPVLILTY